MKISKINIHMGVERKTRRMKSELIATEDIPEGTFLFYHLSEEIDLFINATKTDTTAVWEAMEQYGAGNVFLHSLRSGASTIPNFETSVDSMWDFRFINNCTMVTRSKQTKPNVRLEAKKRVRLPLPWGVIDIRAFYATKDIKAQQELLWHYEYHVRVPGTDLCSCGTDVKKCAELLSRNNNIPMDRVVEKILTHIDTQNADTKYLIKYRGFDSVCNEFVEEDNLAYLDVYKEYRKKLRIMKKKQRMNKVYIIGTSVANEITNADNSSGDEDEDARASAARSRPKEIFLIDREKITPRMLFDNVVYALHTNQEMMRHSFHQFELRYPDLVKTYVDQLPKNNSVQRLKNMSQISVEPTIHEIMESLKLSCIIPDCAVNTKIWRRDELLQHYIVHCGLEFVFSRQWNNMGPEESKNAERVMSAIKKVPRPNDDVVSLINDFSFFTIMEGAELLREKYTEDRMINITDVLTMQFGLNQQSFEDFVSNLKGQPDTSPKQFLKCETCEEIFTSVNGQSALSLLQNHKFQNHFDDVIRCTFFQRRVEPGYKESVYCPNDKCNIKCGGSNGPENLILHLKFQHPGKINKLY